MQINVGSSLSSSSHRFLPSKTRSADKSLLVQFPSVRGCKAPAILPGYPKYPLPKGPSSTVMPRGSGRNGSKWTEIKAGSWDANHKCWLLLEQPLTAGLSYLHRPLWSQQLLSSLHPKRHACDSVLQETWLAAQLLPTDHAVQQYCCSSQVSRVWRTHLCL